MVNLGLNWSSLLGIILAVAGAALYFLRSWRPKLARDHDIFFAAVGLLCGGILLFQGWRLDPILAFGQFMLTGTAIFFAVESIKLRGVATMKAKERAPVVDDDRYVSDVYRVDAELDELEPVEEDYPPQPVARQIRGSRDSRLTKPDTYDSEATRRRPSSRRPSSERPSSERPSSVDRPRKRRPSSRPPSSPRPTTTEEWEASIDSGSDRPYRSRNGRPPSSRDDYSTDLEEPRTRRPRPSERYSDRRERDATSTDYVEYRPVDYSDDDYESSTEY